MTSKDISTRGFPPIRAGTLTARLAHTAKDIEAAQALRYRVFYEEMKAVATAENRSQKRDFDAFDAVCDHLLVIDNERIDLPCGVVGTYRLLRRSIADQNGGFYSADEYDIGRLVASDGEIMELGRSCVDADYRTRPTMQLLWQAIAAYLFEFDIELMFGCASLPGTNPDDQLLPLSYLYHFHRAPVELRPRALDQRYVEMNIMSKDKIDVRDALSSLPPLIKGYLRLGGFIGDGAVIDTQFNTTDVCVVVKTDLMTEKYFKHYERSTRKSAAG